MPQNAASDQGLHCLKIVQTFFFRNIYIIQPDIPKMDKRLFQNIVWESLFSLRVYSALNGLMLSAGIIFWRDFAIFSHFFARNRIRIPGVRKKNRTLNFSHFAPLSFYFAHAVHFETIGLFCLTGF